MLISIIYFKLSVMTYYYYPQYQPPLTTSPAPSIPSLRPPTMSNQRNQNDMSRILEPQGEQGGLYIGNISCAQSPVLLKMYKIGAIVTIDKGNTIRFDKNSIQQHFIMPVSETSSSDSVLKYLDQTVEFISKVIKDTNVMVHCYSGLRLSSAVAMAYLIKNNDITAQKAYSHVKQCRSVANIDRELFSRLKEYQSECRFPKEQYYLPKVQELAQSTVTNDSDEPLQSSSLFDPQLNKFVPTPKPHGIQLTESYEGYF